MGSNDDRRNYLSVVTFELELGHDQEPDRILDLGLVDLTHALEVRGCIVWSAATWWKDPVERNRRCGGLWVAPAGWVGRLDGEVRWRPVRSQRVR